MYKGRRNFWECICYPLECYYVCTMLLMYQWLFSFLHFSKYWFFAFVLTTTICKKHNKNKKFITVIVYWVYTYIVKFHQSSRNQENIAERLKLSYLLTLLSYLNFHGIIFFVCVFSFRFTLRSLNISDLTSRLTITPTFRITWSEMISKINKKQLNVILKCFSNLPYMSLTIM